MAANQLELDRLDREGARSIPAYSPPASIDWRLSGPFPSASGEQRAASSHWDEALRRWTAGHSATEAAHCAAREYGRILLDHSDISRRLKAFIRRTCGVTAGEIRSAWRYLDVTEPVSEDEVFDGWSQDLQSNLPELSGHQYDFGIWYGQDADKVVVVTIWTEASVEMEPFPLETDAAEFVMRGRAGPRVDRVQVVVTEGTTGIRNCTMSGVAPSFEASCPLAVDDERIGVELATWEEGRFLGTSEFDVSIRRPAVDVSRFDRIGPGQALAAEPPRDFNDIVAIINGVRNRLEIDVLTLDEAQSAFADRLVPLYFSANWGDLPEASADGMAMGMMAGWEVAGEVMDAGFRSGWVSASTGFVDWLDLNFETPRGRGLLLDEHSDSIAFGVWEAEGGVGLMVATYDLYEVIEGDEAEQIVRRVLNRQRADNGRPAARRLRHERLEAEMGEQMRAVALGDVDPGEGLDDLLSYSARTANRNVWGWMVNAYRLEDLEFTGMLLDEEDLNLIVGVTSYRPEGSPWRHHVVYILHVTGRVTSADLDAPQPPQEGGASVAVEALLNLF